MSVALEHEILGALIMSPGLLESVDLTAADFSEGPERIVFQKITALWETERVPEVPISLLFEKIPGREGVSFVDSLISGNYAHSVASVEVLARNLRDRRLSAELVRSAQALGEEHLRTGAFDEDGLQRLTALIEQRQGCRGSAKDGAILRRLSEIESCPVEWTWPNRIPRGKLSLLVGDPGLGKSFLSLDIAARISMGRSWPDTQNESPPGSVIILTAEDGLADTVRPRADAAGADISRLIVLEGVLAKGEKQLFSLREHLPALESAIAATPDAALVIIDPLSAYLGELDSHKNAEVRGALAPLSALAEKHGVAILGISHLNKAESTKAIYRVTGSLSFVAAARACWAVVKDEEGEDEERRLLVPVKANLSVRPSSLAFRIEDSRLVFEDQPVRIDADDALSTRGEDREELNYAASWLRDTLQAGPMEMKELLKGATEAGVSKRSLYRAAKRAHVVKKVTGFGKFRTSAWELEK